MFVKQILFAVIGLVGGITVAGGTLALLIKIGVFTRIIEYTKTAGWIYAIESALILGGTLGTIVSIFPVSLPIGRIGLGIYGLLSGMFVGWLSISLAESLSIITILFRRIRLKHGLGLVVFSIAIGKMTGSLLYYYFHWSVL